MYLTKKLTGYYLFFRLHFFRYAEKIYRIIQRRRIQNKDFTIISNNCWGGGIYEDLGLPYKTPTVGLFFFAPCYISFILHLRQNLSLHLSFTENSKYDKANQLRLLNPYPIGKLGSDIEIHFLHYKSQSEAKEKWERRKERINYDNLFISFSDSEGFLLDDLLLYDALPFPKVFFASQKIEGVRSLVYLNKFRNKKHIGDIYTNPWSYRCKFDVVKWLNKSYNSINKFP